MSLKERELRREEWRKYIEDQEKSGLSQLEFCKRNNLSKGKFGYYKSLLQPQQEIKAKFAPVKLNPPSPVWKVADIRVTLPNGFQCIFPSDIRQEKIKDVIRILLSC